MSIFKNTSEHRCSYCRKQGGEAKKWKIYNHTIYQTVLTPGLYMFCRFILFPSIISAKTEWMLFGRPPPCPRHLGWPSSMQAAGFIVNYAQRCLHCRNTRAAAAAHPRHRMQEDAMQKCAKFRQSQRNWHTRPRRCCRETGVRQGEEMEAGCRVELETKVHPKVRNHGEGPY